MSGIVERLRESAALPNGLYAEAADAIEGLLAALVEAKLALEYGAGCDENVTYDVAESEIASWTGSVGAVAYTRIIDAIAKAKGGAS